MMKTVLIAIVCMLLMSPVLPQENGTKSRGLVQYDSAWNGTITLTCKAFAQKREDSNREVIANSYFALLFRGISGSPYQLPMIPDEEEKKDHPAVKALVSGNDRSFITNVVFVSEQAKTKQTDGIKGKETTYRVTIDCEALKRYLAKKGITRKFGI